MKKLLGITLAALVVVTTSACSNPNSNDAAEAPVPVVETDVMLEAFGVIQASNTKNLVIDFPARVEEVLVKEGQLVGRASPLIRLNLDDIHQAISIKEHELEIAKSANTGNAVGEAQEAIRENELAALKRKLDKPYLRGKDIVSDELLAVVSYIGYLPGDMVGPERPVLQLTSMQDLVVQADVLEEFIKEVHVGAKVTVRPVADKGREYTGTVTTIGNMAFQKRMGETTVPVLIALDNADEFLLPGFNVEITIHK